jgi:hypothetical protein
MHASAIGGSGNEDEHSNQKVLDGANYGERAGADVPIHLLLRTHSVDENLFATCVLVGSLFLLVVLDAVSVVVAEAVGTGKR